MCYDLPRSVCVRGSVEWPACSASSFQPLAASRSSSRWVRRQSRCEADRYSAAPFRSSAVSAAHVLAAADTASRAKANIKIIYYWGFNNKENY